MCTHKGLKGMKNTIWYKCKKRNKWDELNKKKKKKKRIKRKKINKWNNKIAAVCTHKGLEWMK